MLNQNERNEFKIKKQTISGKEKNMKTASKPHYITNVMRLKSFRHSSLSRQYLHMSVKSISCRFKFSRTFSDFFEKIQGFCIESVKSGRKTKTRIRKTADPGSGRTETDSAAAGRFFAGSSPDGSDALEPPRSVSFRE